MHTFQPFSRISGKQRVRQTQSIFLICIRKLGKNFLFAKYSTKMLEYTYTLHAIATNEPQSRICTKQVVPTYNIIILTNHRCQKSKNPPVGTVKWKRKWSQKRMSVSSRLAVGIRKKKKDETHLLVSAVDKPELRLRAQPILDILQTNKNKTVGFNRFKS